MTLELLDGAVPTEAADVATVNVLPAQPTVLWTSTADYVAQGSYFPMTARVFNPATPTGTAVDGASLQVTIVPGSGDPVRELLSGRCLVGGRGDGVRPGGRQPRGCVATG